MARTTYPGIGRCIYCGISDETLYDEHIISRALGGTLVFLDASCKRCERITSQIETHCSIGMMSFSRGHLGIQGHEEARARSRMPLWIGDERLSIRTRYHPGSMTMFGFYPSTGFSGPPRQTGMKSRMIVRRFVSCDEDALALTALALSHPKGMRLLPHGFKFYPLVFARMLAKIAHSYVTATFQDGSFVPLLLNFIQREAHRGLYKYIKSSDDRNFKSVSYTHKLSSTMITQNGENFIVVNVHLFGSIGFPVHSIVAAQLNAS